MRRTKVIIGYPGSVISVNHYKYRGGIYTKPQARAFMEELGWLIKTEHIEDWKLPLTVKCDGVFRNRRNRPDLSNLGKIILDSLEEASGVNDRDMRWVDGSVSYGEESYLTITITEAE